MAEAINQRPPANASDADEDHEKTALRRDNERLQREVERLQREIRILSSEINRLKTEILTQRQTNRQSLEESQFSRL